MNNTTINGVNYQVRKLPAYPEQMLLAKAIMPIYQDLIPVITRVLGDKEMMAAVKAGAPPRELILDVMDRGFTAIQKMSDDELLALTQRSLVAVQVQQGQAGWADVMLPNGQLMYNTIELPDILQLIWKVAEVNLGGFFAAALGTSQGVPEKV